MTGHLPMWIGLGSFTFLAFLGLGAAIRPLWIPLGIAFVSSLIWVYGLGLAGFLAGALGAGAGVLAGSGLRRLVFAVRARRTADRTNSSPGGLT